MDIKGAFCILGYPLSHTLSPLMQNFSFNHHGLEFSYIPFETPPDKLPQAIEAIRVLGIRGANLTIPHKEEAVHLLDEIDEEAKRIGAVNTICLRGEKLVGYNTDGKGFLKSMHCDANVIPDGKKILLIGAGGASKGIAASLLAAGVKDLVIANRSLGRATELVEYLKNTFSHSPSISPLALANVGTALVESRDIIINTTSLGMKKKSPPLFDYNSLKSSQLVCDIIYNPAETPLLQAAKNTGAKALNGLGMLIYQGALAFNIWTGKEMPVKEVRELLLNKLEERG